MLFVWMSKKPVIRLVILVACCCSSSSDWLRHRYALADNSPMLAANLSLLVQRS